MSIESIVNNALDQIGYSRRIGSIYEGTPAARAALDLWAQTRDSLLYTQEPHWAKKDAPLVLAKIAPNIQGSTAQYDLIPWSNIYPPLPWLYEYSLPLDNLKPLQIKPQAAFLPVWRPRAQSFRHTILDTGQEVLLTNTPDAILTYIYKVFDPDLWHQDFQDAVIQTLAQKMQVEFGKQPVQAKGAGNANAAG